MTRIVQAPHPIRRPYITLFMVLRQQCSALIEQMERKSSRLLPPPETQWVTEEWEAYNPGLIIARVDWDNARLVLNWGLDGDHPVRAKRSPDYLLDMSELKRFALAADRPRAFFDSYALHLLSVSQSDLVEFFRDGPSDDIPFYRHLIFAHEEDAGQSCIWINNVLFEWDEGQD